MMGIVIDASVSASWLFDDEDDTRAVSALAALEEMAGLVPRLWHYEIRNILLVAHRRGRLTEAGITDRVQALPDLPLETDDDPELDRALDLAAAHGLSFYDALYLELAQRRASELASLDERLLQAVRAEGVAIHS